MRSTKSSNHVLRCMSHVLGQVSLWMGVILAWAWSVLFAVMARHMWVYQGSASSLWLPFEPPLVGLSLAVLALALTSLGHQPIVISAVAGAILNGVAMALAIALVCGCLG